MIAIVAVIASCSRNAGDAPPPPTPPEAVVVFDRPAPRTLTPDQVEALLDLAYDQAGAPGLTSSGVDVRTRAREVIETESGRRVDALEQKPDSVDVALADGGAPSAGRGLGMLIPATFLRHHRPSTSMNIYDPVANVAALMAYLGSNEGQ
ncbi:hypothetical protein [Gordonia malaquae]|uniref:hypothetical protein n=1 Tax=Gordonia malaquae TaxID=410332 RepID=UPI003018A4C5